MKAHHIGVVVKDLDKSVQTYKNLLGFEQVGETFVIDTEEYAIRFAFVRANGILLELLEPARGPWVQKLAERGDGSMWELCMVVEDIEAYYDQMKEQGILLEDRFGRPLVDRKSVTSEVTGNKFGYLPRGDTNGLWVEILEQAGTKLW